MQEIASPTTPNGGPSVGDPTGPNASAKANAQAFITRWQCSTASELSTAQSFVRELCELLGVDAPHPPPEQGYMFERPITFAHGDGRTGAGRIDCSRRSHFVLESKKLNVPRHPKHTKGFDDALLRARALPSEESRPRSFLAFDVWTSH